MKNLYFIINKEGEVVDIESYRGASECSASMAVCIDREVYKKPPARSLWRDPLYIKNAKKLGFEWESNSVIGFMRYDYKAHIMLRSVKEYARQLVYGLNFPIYEVSGSNFFSLEHPVVESYAQLFGDRLFKFKGDSGELVMSYDASYPQFNLASEYKYSDCELPFAHFSISDCYRYEKSGECMLLFRGRRFYMPDLHPYCKDIEQAFDLYFDIESKIKAGFNFARREYINIAKFSSPQNWESYGSYVQNIAKRNGQEILVDVQQVNEEKYWIINIDYSFLDSLGQIREVGCIQIDIGNAKRLNIKSQDGNSPVIIHAAVPGGIDRYLYMLLDNLKLCPVYFHPIQVRIIPVGEQFLEFAQAILKEYDDIRIDIDSRSEGVSKRIKRAHDNLVPNILVVGEKEVQDRKLIDKKLMSIRAELEGLPKINASLPRLGFK